MRWNHTQADWKHIKPRARGEGGWSSHRRRRPRRCDMLMLMITARIHTQKNTDYDVHSFLHTLEMRTR